MNLLDIIQQKRSQPQQAAPADQGARVRELLGAKSGKAGASQGPMGMSNLAESSANDQTNLALNQDAQNQGTSQAGQVQQARGQEQQFQNQNASINQERRAGELDRTIKTERTLQELEQGKGRLNQMQEISLKEQVAQDLRLSNTKYVDELQRSGKKDRLDDELAFQQALTKDIFGNNTELLKQKLGDREILDLSDREFGQLLAQMGSDDAWRAYQNQVDQARVAGNWQAAGSIIQAGVGAYGASTPASGTSATPGSSASDYTSLSNQGGQSASSYTNLP